MWNAKYSNSSHPYANSALHQTWIFTSGQSPDWVVTLIALPMLRPEQLLSGEECLAWQISLQVLSPIKLQKKKFMGNCKILPWITGLLIDQLGVVSALLTLLTGSAGLLAVVTVLIQRTYQK